MIAGRQAAEGDAAVRRDRLAPAAIHRDRVAVGIDVRARGAGRHRQTAARRAAAHRERRRAGATRRHGDGPRVVPAHAAVPGDARKRHAVIARGDSAEGHDPVRGDRFALASVHGDRVAVGIEIGAGRGGRDREVPRCRGRRATDSEGGGPQDAGHDRHGPWVVAADRAVSRDVRERHAVIARCEPGKRDDAGGRDPAALIAVNGHGVAVRVEGGTCGDGRDSERAGEWQRWEAEGIGPRGLRVVTGGPHNYRRSS